MLFDIIRKMNLIVWKLAWVWLIKLNLVRATPGFPEGSRFLSVGRRKFAMGQKFKFFGDELIVNILKWQMKSKKKGLSWYISNFETYTTYFEVADEKQKTNKS